MASSDYRSHRQRLKTFSGEPQLPVSAILLSTAGFVQSENQQIKCPFCHLELSNLHSAHSILAWHRTYSKGCNFLRENDSLNIKDLEIQFPDIISSTVVLNQVLPLHRPRDETFADLPLDIEVTPDLVRPSSDAGHLTIQNTAGDNIDGGDELPTNPDEVLRIYQANRQLKHILDKQQIELLKSSRQQEVQGLATDSFNYEYRRRLSFSNWPIKDVVSPKSLAASGFKFTGNRDVAECVYCKLRVQGWTSDMVPDVVHQSKSPGCQFIQGSRTVLNIPDFMSQLFDDVESLLPSADRQISQDLGIITDTTKHPQLAVDSRREATFLTWPRTNRKMAAEMIEAKLFYLGEGDTVCCFSCGVEMSNWTTVENIWVRHARQSPNCQLLIREKGQDFINDVIDEHGRYVVPAKEPVINIVTTRMLRPRMDSPAAQAVLDMTDPAYRREDVRAALILNIKYGGNDFMNTADLVRAILKKRSDDEDLTRVRQAIESEPPPPAVVSEPRPPPAAVAAPGAAETREGSVPSTDVTLGTPRSETQDLQMGATGGPAARDGPELGSGPSTSGQRVATPPLPGDPMEMAKAMKLQLMCKICMDAVVGIAFLPCGHMVCCPSCAPAMVQCPLCRQDVKGTVRAYLDKL